MNKPHTASFEIKAAPKLDGPILLTVEMKQEYMGNNWQLGKFRWSITRNKKPVDFGHPKNIADLLALAADKRDAKQKKTLKDYYNKQDAQLQNLTNAVVAAKKPRPIDPKLKEHQAVITRAQAPLLIDPKLAELNRAVGLSTKQLPNKRLIGAQDIAWALINSPAFLFNH